MVREDAKFEYEPHRIYYEVPAKKKFYTPDFQLLDNGIYLEFKGYFRPENRETALNVRRSNPDLDIRFVFQNPKVKINKKSKTTYADWCDQHGFMWADKFVPKEWIDEQKE